MVLGDFWVVSPLCPVFQLVSSFSIIQVRLIASPNGQWALKALKVVAEVRRGREPFRHL